MKKRPYFILSACLLASVSVVYLNVQRTDTIVEPKGSFLSDPAGERAVRQAKLASELAFIGSISWSQVTAILEAVDPDWCDDCILDIAILLDPTESCHERHLSATRLEKTDESILRQSLLAAFLLDIGDCACTQTLLDAAGEKVFDPRQRSILDNFVCLSSTDLQRLPAIEELVGMLESIRSDSVRVLLASVSLRSDETIQEFLSVVPNPYSRAAEVLDAEAAGAPGDALDLLEDLERSDEALGAFMLLAASSTLPLEEIGDSLTRHLSRYRNAHREALDRIQASAQSTVLQRQLVEHALATLAPYRPPPTLR